MCGVEILEKWFDLVWVKADLLAVGELLDQNALAQGLIPDLAAQIEDFKTLVPAVLSLVRDVSFKIVQSMEKDEKAWALIEFKAMKAADMSPVSITGQVMIRTENGKIVEAYNQFDFVSLFEQLGLLPENTSALCLSGVALT